MGDFDFGQVRQAFEVELESCIRSSVPPEYHGMLPLVSYHLGWEGEGAGAEAQGKRVRPLLVLLACAAGGGAWQKALPAARAVELIHNFSLIHDDIQDNSPLRRGRPTLWTKWGVAQAINAGDLLFNLAFTSVLQLDANYAPEITLQAVQILTETCTRLTGGQYLDLSYESRRELTLESYWPMIAGKTAALLSCCTELGAICAEMSAQDRLQFKVFGQKLGLAFQVWDDWLGIWGDSAITGKSVASDLLSGKKSLPVLFALAQNGSFARRWKHGEITEADLPDLSAALVSDGAQSYTEATAIRLTDEALEALDKTSCNREGCLLLKEFSNSLLYRKH